MLLEAFGGADRIPCHWRGIRGISAGACWVSVYGEALQRLYQRMLLLA